MAAINHRNYLWQRAIATSRYRMRRRMAAALLSLALGLTPATGADAEQAMTLSINGVDATGFPWVTSYVTVASENGQPVLGLGPGNFEVLVDGVPAERLEVSTVVNSEEALSAVLVVDVSGSMEAEAMAAAKGAAATFINSLGGLDSASIIAFSTEVRLVHGFTRDKEALLQALEGLQPGGNTALYDALWTGIETAAGSGTARKIVVLETDGQNTRSQAGLDDGINLARAGGVPVYTIGLGRDLDRQVLSHIAESTGAAALFTPSSSGLEQAYRSVIDALRNQYVLRYYSPVRQGARDYKLTIRASQLLTRATGEVSFRANPAPPVIRGLSLGDATLLREPVELIVDLQSTQPVNDLTIEVNGRPVARSAGESHSFLLQPADFGPGRHQLALRATTEAGSTTTKRLSLTVPADVPMPERPAESAAPGPGITAPPLAAILSALLKPLEGVTGLCCAGVEELVSGMLAGVETFATETVPGFLLAHYRTLVALLMAPVATGASFFQVKRLAGKARERLRKMVCPDCGSVYRAYEGECLSCRSKWLSSEQENRDIGTVLIENGLITPAALEEALAMSNTTRTPLASLLVESGKITEDQANRARFYRDRSQQMVERRRQVLLPGARRSFWQARAFLPSLVVMAVAVSAWALAIPLVLT